jgi:hypothetical protein
VSWLEQHALRTPGREALIDLATGRSLTYMPNGPRDSRTFKTATGKAMFAANTVEVLLGAVCALLLKESRSAPAAAAVRSATTES